MPLEQRVIQPIYVSRGCFNNHDQQPQTNVPNELECVTNGTLGNIIRQLSSLSRHAENLFGCLLDDLDSMMQRSAALNLRIETLTHYVENLDASNDSLINDPYQRNNNQSHKTTGVDQFDQQVVARTTIPDSLREVYERCDPPPALDKLNPFRDDNINGLKLYTNPNYFFELWRKEMLKDKSNKSSKVAKNKQGDIHSSGGKSSKRNRQQLIHQTSSDSASTYSQHLPPPPPPMPNHQQYPNIQQQHYHQGYYSQQPSQSNVPQQMEILTAKMNQTTGPYTVIEGSYIDPNNYQHHYVQHQYNKNISCQNGPNNTSIPLTYQQQQSRPNSLELQQQNYYNNYNSNQSGGGYTGVNNQRISNQYGGSTTGTAYQQTQQQQYTPPQNSPSTTMMTPTRRLSGAQVSRPSAPPPAPPSTGNSAPNSQPGTPLHKKTTIINGQEVEMREQMNGGRMSSRDSLPPPPPPPPNVQMSNGLNVAADMHDVNDSALPPPPPPPPPTFNGNNNNFTSIPTPPPPPNENGSISNNSNTNAQYKLHTTAIPTVEELKSVVLKKIDSSTAQNNDHQSKDIRSNLLAAIRHGIKLRRVEESRQREVEQNAPLHDVASILARRVAMELSDSEGDGVNGDDGNDSDAWDDESEC